MRAPCPACSKAHNSMSAAVDCRMRKANALARRSAAAVHGLRIPLFAFGDSAEDVRQGPTMNGVPFREYLALERRADAVGGTE